MSAACTLKMRSGWGLLPGLFAWAWLRAACRRLAVAGSSRCSPRNDTARKPSGRAPRARAPSGFAPFTWRQTAMGQGSGGWTAVVALWLRPQLSSTSCGSTAHRQPAHAQLVRRNSPPRVRRSLQPPAGNKHHKAAESDDPWHVGLLACPWLLPSYSCCWAQRRLTMDRWHPSNCSRACLVERGVGGWGGGKTDAQTLQVTRAAICRVHHGTQAQPATPLLRSNALAPSLPRRVGAPTATWPPVTACRTPLRRCGLGAAACKPSTSPARACASRSQPWGSLQKTGHSIAS